MKVAEDQPAKPKPKIKRRLRIPKNALLVRFFLHPAGKTLLIVLASLLIASTAAFVHYYNFYAHLIDERLRGGAYTATARIYASPSSVAVGDPSSPNDIAMVLRHAGYSENRKNPVGYYTVHPD